MFTTDPTKLSALLLEQQIDWAERFGRRAPLELEIGFGYGHFLLERAKAMPDHDFIGIEIRKKLATGLARKARAAGLTNLEVFAGDARRLLSTLFAKGSLHLVHVQFPDPWWKKRHHKRRLVDEQLADQVHLLLEVGGRLILRTDILGYGRAMVEVLEGERFVNLAGAGAFSADDGLGIPSNRERRYLASGTPVYRLVYEARRLSQGARS